ncbi:hypothetical protein COO51_19615, partial [Yersinia enterocolitica]
SSIKPTLSARKVNLIVLLLMAVTFIFSYLIDKKLYEFIFFKRLRCGIYFDFIKVIQRANFNCV